MKRLIILYIIFCLVGAGLEWIYGSFWGLIGTAPWVYHNSPISYTSLEGLPLWGFGGLVCVSVYRAILEQKIKRLLGVVPPLVLAVLWITIYEWFIA